MFNFKADMVDDLSFLSDLYYVKILRINLKTDSYEIIKQLDFESPLDTTLSGWLEKFAYRYVKESDRSIFISNCSLKLWLEQLAQGIIPDFYYSRQFGQCLSPVEMIVFPSIKYTEDEPICYIFIKEVI